MISVLIVWLWLVSALSETRTFKFSIKEDTTNLYDLNSVAILGYASLMGPIAETPYGRYTVTVNKKYPGEVIDVTEGDTIRLIITNELREHPTILHLHGIDNAASPWNDGAPMVSECLIPAGKTITKDIIAWPAGTHMYHSHAVEQALEGVVGPVIVRKKLDPYANMYSEEVILTITDVYENPMMLHVNFWQPLKYIAVNGKFGDGSTAYPYFRINVDSGKCYRLRWIMGLFELCGININIANHKQTVISNDGRDIDPIVVDTLAGAPGMRFDTILCADQAPGNYWVTIDAPPKYSFPSLSDSFQTLGQQFHAIIHYNGFAEPALGAASQTPLTDKGVMFDTIWNLDDVHTITGSGEVGHGGVPPATMYRELDIGSTMITVPDMVNPGSQGNIEYEFYMWDSPMYWPAKFIDASTPILHTHGQCCLHEQTFMITIEESGQVLDLVINNRNNLVHSLHLHGPGFFLIGNGYTKGGNLGFEAAGGDGAKAPCGDKVRYSDPSFKAVDRWGCPFDPELDKDRLNFVNPPIMDTVGVPPYSWVYIRYVASTPGAWAFHCHTYDHTLRGMKVVLNVQPKNQPEPPASALRCGPCATTYSPSLAQPDTCPLDINPQHCTANCDAKWSVETDRCEGDRTACKSVCKSNDQTCSLNCDLYYSYCATVAQGRSETCAALCGDADGVFVDSDSDDRP